MSFDHLNPVIRQHEGATFNREGNADPNDEPKTKNAQEKTEMTINNELDVV